MTIQVGDRIPEATVKVMGEKGPRNITTDELFAGKKVVLFAVPGAFTPGCSKSHLPGYVNKADEIKAKGVDSIICLAVNDAFVMDAWGKAQHAEKLLMVADGNAELAKAMGVDMDGSGYGMGTRCKRMAMIAENGKVTHLAIEPGGEIGISSADEIIKQL